MTYFIVGIKDKNLKTREIEAIDIKTALNIYAVANDEFEIVEIKKQGYRKIIEGEKR